MCFAICAAVRHGLSASELSENTKPFSFRDNDRIVLLGNTLIERETRYGRVELALTLRHASKRLAFRNLGWSGDNVFGEARAYFGAPADGYKHLMQYVDLIKPTVIFVGYGNNAAFDGREGLDRFIKQYGILLGQLEKRTKRIIVLSPTPAKNLGAPLPDMTALNDKRRLYFEAIGQLAKKRGLRYVDLFRGLLKRQAESRLTDNGVHFTDRGYDAIAKIIDHDLAGGAAPPSISPGARKDIHGLILEKNELFFYRYRPQNETYLRGFRKHEQGQNAVEILRFDSLVQKKEREISKLCKEAAHAPK